MILLLYHTFVCGHTLALLSIPPPKVSTTKEQERELEDNGYKVVDANVNKGTFGPPVHVW